MRLVVMALLAPYVGASFLDLFNLGGGGRRRSPPPRSRSLGLEDFARQGLGLFSYFRNIRRDVGEAPRPKERRSEVNLLGTLTGGLSERLPKIPFLEGVPIVPGVAGSIPGAGECLPAGIPFFNRHSPSFFQNLLRTFPGSQDFLRAFQEYPKAINPNNLKGKWHWVLITPAVHSRYCATTDVNAVTVLNSTYASFGTVDHYRDGAPNGPPKLSFGYGLKDRRKISFYSQADPCPYEVVMVGPKSGGGQYEYLVLSNWAKYPIVGLARDVRDFHRHHREHMEKRLRAKGYINFLTQSLGSVQYADWSRCSAASTGNIIGNILNGLFG